MKNIMIKIRINIRSIILSLLLVMLTACVTTINSATGVFHDPSMPIHVGLFSQNSPTDVIPAGWQELSFPSVEQQSVYTIVQHSNKNVVKAVSDGGASGILKKVDIDPKQFPILRWHWNIGNVLKNADINSKSGDDYPARIYITFDYDISKLSSNAQFKARMYALLHGELPPLATINYIWDNKTPINTIQSSAYTDRVKMIVIQSGSAKLQQWLSEERNIYEDFKAAFGEEPPHINGIAIMTDTDNTGGKATAYFGDISFHPLTTAQSE